MLGCSLSLALQPRDYYLVRDEREALELNKAAIIDWAGQDPLELVDLGAGDGTKMTILMEEVTKRQCPLTYVPVDISAKFLRDAEKTMAPFNIPIRPLEGDYHDVLNELRHSGMKMLTFMGSNIGNFSNDAALRFLKKIRQSLTISDCLLIGFDLVKNPEKILRAYNDREGHTRQFNLNLLHRLNREFNGDIDVNNFEHYPVFNPQELAAKSFLVSKTDQTVHFKRINTSIDFKQWEFVHTETSQKYTLAGIESLAKATGFSIDQFFFSADRGYVIARFACEKITNFMKDDFTALQEKSTEVLS